MQRSVNGARRDIAATVRQRPREHVRVYVPEPVCKGCLMAWPCPTVRGSGAPAAGSEIGWSSGSCGSSDAS
jgi:hypothetical protein